jgi:superfamily II DNA or RNA helicase
MHLTPEQISSVRSIKLPARWTLHYQSRVADIISLGTRPRVTAGTCIPFRAGDGRIRQFRCASDEGEIIIALGAPSTKASKAARVIRSKSAKIENGVLELIDARWQRHPENIPFSLPAARQRQQAVLSSWAPGINYRREAAGQPGLRIPQIGALHAIASHWTLNTHPGIIVMPTGTGKTEVMVAATVAARGSTVLVVVPSDALRSQTAAKFETFGVLQSIGTLPDDFLFPVVGLLRGVPKKRQDLASFDCCNVVVATMSALAGASSPILNEIAERSSHLFIDEAHHAPAETWHDLSQRFNGKPILQFTATPFRRDGRRMDGRILYNYPLATAQRDGYFQPIRFEQVWEWDERAADKAIADTAIERLREDLKNGFDHILMARADSITRAQSLYDKIYGKYPDLKPVVIHNRTPGRRKVLEAIKGRHHRVIVCVDMLGEGFDLPQLKIAALHNAHRSLGVTVQFAGRFTRTSDGIGSATVVANLADPKVSEALEDLYSEDADWNVLLADLSYDAIQPQVSLSDFVSNLTSSTLAGESEIFSPAALRPKTSTLIYKSDGFYPQGFKKAIKANCELISSWNNVPEKVLIFIVRRRETLDWAYSKDVTHQIYDLYAIFYDAPNKLLFINSSIKGAQLPLAKCVGKNVAQLRGETMFRALGRLERIVFYNAGILRGRRGAVRFQMFSGLDVAKAIDPIEQQDATKSNLFGAGYEQGKRVTIGCSQKGSLWSLSSSSVPEWRDWCLHVGAKILDASISTTGYLERTLIPKEIDALPSNPPICIEWPNVMFEGDPDHIEFLRKDERISWLDCDLDLGGWPGDHSEFSLVFPDGTRSTARLELRSGDNPFTVTEPDATGTVVRVGEVRQSLSEFFQDYPPLLRFADGGELQGNILIKPRSTPAFQLPLESLEVKDWRGVDLTKESKWKSGKIRADSVQGYVIDRLLTDNTFDFVIDDDDSGEAADVIGIRDTNEQVEVELFHCKFAGSVTTSSRAGDLYVVAGQATKGVMWTLEFGRLADHFVHRETKSRNGRPSRFERGSLKDLSALRRAARKKRIQYSMIVVQPGLSKAAFTPEHSSILGATSLFLRQRLGVPLRVWVSS